MKKTIDIVCPVFAEGAGISTFHDRLSKVMTELESRYTCRVFYVVDPAGDDTEDALEDLARRDPQVEVIVMSRRFGHQMALVGGMDASTGDAVVMLDSDLQHPPELILQLVEHWEAGGDVVQAIRNDGHETASWKRITSRWFYKTFMSVGTIELKSGAADYRLLSRKVVDVFKTEMREHSPFLRGLVSWVGFNVRFVHFKPDARASGTTKYRLSTLIEFAINGVTSFSKMPLRICIGFGMTVALCSILFGAFSVVSSLFSSRTVLGWPTLISTMTFLGGVQLIFMGVLGEYISVIFDEVKDRPRYIVARRFAGSREAPAPVERLTHASQPSIGKGETEVEQA